jgi:S-formylglutathione hydrolase
MSITTISEHACHGGVLGYYRHESTSTRCEMRFAVYAPPQAVGGRVPVLYCLAGLTCTEETFVTKAGALRDAARHGLMLVAPDTSPRVSLPGDRDSWDFGIGAGFYVDATQPPWNGHYRMYSYVADELPRVVGEHFRADLTRSGILGHSMGGHGALTLALRHPDKYRSVSAFAPICAPSRVPWGVKAFSGYLGEDRAAWAAHDATELLRAGRRFPGVIRVEQGTADKFLGEQLKPEWLVEACTAAGQELDLRQRAGYDHGYFFIQSFISQHLAWHAHRLLGLPGR